MQFRRSVNHAAGLLCQLCTRAVPAIHLTRLPHTLNVREIDLLREHGLSDAGVHDVIGVAAYFNFVNRLVLGVHLPLEIVLLGDTRN